MKKISVIIVTGLLIVIAVLFSFAAAADQNHTELFSFAVEQMKADPNTPMPEIKLVSKEFLQDIWKSLSAPEYPKWVKLVGKEEADKVYQMHIDGIQGIFNPRLEPRVIYICESIEECKRESIIVHEMVHYLQNYNGGRMDGMLNIQVIQHDIFEMQAEQIQEKYLKKRGGE